MGGLQTEDAADDLKVVLYPVMHLLEQDLFLVERPEQLHLCCFPIGDPIGQARYFAYGTFILDRIEKIFHPDRTAPLIDQFHLEWLGDAFQGGFVSIQQWLICCSGDLADHHLHEIITDLQFDAVFPFDRFPEMIITDSDPEFPIKRPDHHVLGILEDRLQSGSLLPHQAFRHFLLRDLVADTENLRHAAIGSKDRTEKDLVANTGAFYIEQVRLESKGLSGERFLVLLFPKSMVFWACEPFPGPMWIQVYIWRSAMQSFYHLTITAVMRSDLEIRVHGPEHVFAAFEQGAQFGFMGLHFFARQIHVGHIAEDRAHGYDATIP